MLRADTHAASAPFSFAVAGVLFIAAVGSVLVAAQDQGRDDSSSRQQNLGHDAQAILERFAGSKGAGWEAGVDSLVSIGLRSDNGSGIDLGRMQTLKGAVYDTQQNGKLDYDEALLLLGIDPDGAGRFHLRISPVGLQTVLTEDLSGLDTAYLADAGSFSLGNSVASGSDAQMAADARAYFDGKLRPITANERAALTSLGLGYDDEVHVQGAGVKVDNGQLLDDVVADQGVLSGDIYPDHKQYLDGLLAGRLAHYDVLVVGSNVDHNALTSNHVKGAISDWVHAGGVLIVFGSDAKSFQWLESTMGVGVETVNGGAYSPDVDHPILNEPHRLDWSSYDSFGQAWGGKSDKSNGGKSFDELFQHVISSDDGDVLAISMDGAFGAGRVFLSTFRPGDIADKISLQESMGLINNIVVYADRSHLFLDYGPPPPQDQPVGGASMTSHVWDETYGQVPVRVTVLAWGT